MRTVFNKDVNCGYAVGQLKVPGQATGAVWGVRKNGQLAPWRSCRVPPTLRKSQVRALPSLIGRNWLIGAPADCWLMGTPLTVGATGP